MHCYGNRFDRTSHEAAKTLIQALVISRLDYCNSILYGIPAIQTNKLQRVQNAAARLLTNTPRYSHITPVMVDLQWLPVKFRIIFISIITQVIIEILALSLAENDVIFRYNHLRRGDYSGRTNFQNSGLALCQCI